MCNGCVYSISYTAYTAPYTPDFGEIKGNTHLHTCFCIAVFTFYMEGTNEKGKENCTVKKIWCKIRYWQKP